LDHPTKEKVTMRALRQTTFTATFFFAVILVSGMFMAACGGGGGGGGSTPETSNNGSTGGTSNTAPVAKAGSDQNVRTGSTVTLEGSSSTDADSDSLSYSWQMIGEPSGSTATLSSSSAVKPTFTADVDGTYVLSLVVNDGTTDSAADTVTITATTGNAAPVANAGPDQNVSTGTLVILDGSGSSDADRDTLTYTWVLTTKPGGSTATIFDATAVKPTFIADVDGTYVFSLVVNDGTADSTAGTVAITARSARQAEIVVSGSINRMVDFEGDIKLLGEITNTGNKTASFCAVNCTFYDRSGFILDKDDTYVDGSCVKLPTTLINTSTALAPGDIGAFKLYTSIKDATVSSYECTTSSEDYEVSKPSANMQISGPITENSSLGSLQLSGSVVNSGVTDLTFGEVFVAVKNLEGKIIDTDFTYITGVSVYLESISDFTDTALYAGGIGSFTMYTLADYNSYSNYYFNTCLDDAVIDQGVVHSSSLSDYVAASTSNEKEKTKERDDKIDRIRQHLTDLYRD